MAKAKTVFVCSNCGYESAKWLGKCPSCMEWNSFYEEKLQTTNALGRTVDLKKASKPQKLNTVEGKEEARESTTISELDRVLGGGLVKGSLILLGGEPGIGKSTLILELCSKIAKDGEVLYVSGEESKEQVKLRADRLNIDNDNILFLGETDIDLIENEVLSIKPKLLVLDSIQTIYSNDISSAAGTVSQVREITARVMNVCKKNKITTVIIGHVTKDGTIAGPRVLEHMVDTVLYIEGERYFSYRIVRSVKNRFGSTNEIAMFEMANEGMIEVTNPSKILISEDGDEIPGSCIVCSLEGTRPLLVELQALTIPTMFGIPKRTGQGVDYNKIAVLIAVLEKRAGIALTSSDVYLNVVSGMKISEPAIDLGIAMCMVSSYKNTYIPKDTCIIGELGLTGEIRSVNMIDKRLKEVERLGIKKCIIPENNKRALKNNYKLDIIGVKNINDAIKALGMR